MKKVIKYKNHIITIVEDDYPINPRKEYDNLGIILCTSTKYNLSDRKCTSDQIEAITQSQDHIFLPVYLYDHSGITISTSKFSCPWDSGQVGIIYMTRENAIQNFPSCAPGVILKDAFKCLESEILEFDQYLRGECYCYSITDNDLNLVDECCSFLGPIEYVESEAKATIDHILKNKPTQLTLF